MACLLSDKLNDLGYNLDCVSVFGDGFVRFTVQAADKSSFSDVVRVGGGDPVTPERLAEAAVGAISRMFKPTTAAK